MNIKEAFAKARELIDRYGQDDPRAIIAMLDAVNLADPGFIDKALKESGIKLPEPGFVDDAGNPCWTSQEIADSVGVPHEQVMRDIESLRDDGHLEPVRSAHRIQ